MAERRRCKEKAENQKVSHGRSGLGRVKNFGDEVRGVQKIFRDGSCGGSLATGKSLALS